MRVQALRLLRKADEDRYAASCLANSPAASIWNIGFHAQQAVEKSLKSVLMRQGVRYPFTHDIAALIKLVFQADLPLPPDSDDLFYLTPFGTLFRYEVEEWGLPESLDVSRLLGWANATVAWPRSVLTEDEAS